MLEALERKHQFVIIDRGIFDSLIWTQWHCKLKNLTKKEKQSIEQFLLIGKWRLYIDVIFLMTSNPQVALEREHKNLLTQRPGRIMNEETLVSLKNALQETHEAHKGKFRRVEIIDTSKTTSIQCGEIVVRKALQALNESIY